MRDFSKISPSVWSSARFNDLPSDDARYLYLFFLTSEHQNSAGLYRLKDEYAVADLRWTLEKYSRARQELVAADLIRFDAGTSTVFITRWFKHNPPMNDSHFTGVLKVIKKFGDKAFQNEAEQDLIEAYEAVKAAKQKPKAPQPAPQPLGPVNGETLSPAMRDTLARKGWNNGGGLAA